VPNVLIILLDELGYGASVIRVDQEPIEGLNVLYPPRDW
jgi:hypothetical protein